MMKLLLAFLLVASACGDDLDEQMNKVELNLDFTGYDGVTGCEEENENVKGTSLSVSVLEAGVFCEVTEYTIYGEEWTEYTKVEYSCTSAGIGRTYYKCKDEECGNCGDDSYQYAVAPWEDVDQDQDDLDIEKCYSSTATVDDEEGDNGDEAIETIVITASWKFVKGSNEDDVIKFLDVYSENSCIGDGIPENDVDDADEGSTDADEEGVNACVTIEEVICGDDELGKQLTAACALYKRLVLEPLESPVTFFAPTDNAIRHLLKLIDANEKDDLSEDNVSDIFFFHAMDGATLYNDLVCTDLHEMFNGELSRTKCKNNDDGLSEKYQKGGGNRKNDILPKIIIADILACNGSIVHVINEVMLPNYVDIIE